MAQGSRARCAFSMVLGPVGRERKGDGRKKKEMAEAEQL